MSNIKAIKHLTVYQDLDTTREIVVNPRIHVQPDVCIIRNINYCGLYNDMPGVYMIKADFSEDIIGSFAVRNLPEQPSPNPDNPVSQMYSTVNVSPQTIIHITKLINSNSQIKFNFFIVDGGNQQLTPFDKQLTGELSIMMDFITYK